MEDKIYELCPLCEDEVQLDNIFKVQTCPTCGKAIVPCSICPSLAKGICTYDSTDNKCKLCVIADEINGE